MARTFVLGIDCILYFMPEVNRVTTGDAADLRPKQLMSGGTYDTSAVSSYCVVKTTQDVTLNLTSSTADVTSRHSNGWRQVVSALKEGSVDFTVLWQPDDPVFDGMMTAYLNQCPVAFIVADGPIEGFPLDCSAAGPILTGGDCGAGQGYYSIRCGECGDVTGLHADFVITSFTRNEALEEGVTADVTIEPAVGMIYPEWLDIPQQES